jgi:hypothetical protein
MFTRDIDRIYRHLLEVIQHEGYPSKSFAGRCSSACVIDSMTMSAPFSRACWLDSAPPTLLERGSRHSHGINNVMSQLRLLLLS